MENDVAIGLNQLDLVVPAVRLGLRHEIDVEWLVGMRVDRFVGDHAALAKAGFQSPPSANDLTLPLERGVSIQPVEGAKTEALSNTVALLAVGG